MPKIGSYALTCLCLATALDASAAVPQKVDLDLAQLLVQGHYWVDRGHYELARFAWEKVLRVDPSNREANFGITDLDALHPELIDYEELKRARTLALQGNYIAALEAYRAAFRGYHHGSLLSAEYLETLGGTPDGWESAVRDLRLLVERYPSSQRYDLILHRVLSYREWGRREAIKGLQRIATDPKSTEDIKEQAREAWRNALLWLNARKSDTSLYRAYLEHYPNDTEIARQLAELKRPQVDNLRSAWALFKRGEYEAAALGFKAHLYVPGVENSARIGLGLTRLRQKRFASAAYHLDKALKQEPTLDSPELRQALADAQFWARYKTAEKAYQNGDLERASKLAQSLLQTRPNQSEAALLLAAIYASSGEYASAQRLYEQELNLNPANLEARQGLLQALIHADDEAQALALVRRYHLPEQTFLDTRNQIAAERLWQAAKQSKQLSLAISALEKALALNPEHVWARLELARLYRIADRETEARVLFDAFQPAESNLAHFRYAQAIFYSELEDWQAALDALKQIPKAQRDDTAQELEDEIALRLLQRRVHQLLRVGDRESAQSLLPPKQDILALPPEQQLIIAAIIADLGDKQEALELAKRAYEQPNPDTFKQGILYFSVLLQTKQLDPAAQILETLQQRSDLSLYQQASLEKLDHFLLFATAQYAVQSGDMASALQALTALKTIPNYHDSARLLEAQLYAAHDRNDEALSLYEQVLQDNPQQIDAIAGAYGSALKLGRMQHAGELLRRGLEANPDAARLKALQGHLEALNGKALRARSSYEQALQLYHTQTTTSQAQTTPDWVASTQEALARLTLDATDWVALQPAWRTRDGDKGLDQLDEGILNLHWQTHDANGSILAFDVKPVQLDAGDLDLASPQATRFGSLALQPNPAFSTGRLAQHDDGIALSAAWESESWRVQLGSTPLGFREENLTAAFAWQNHNLSNQINLTLERIPVTESLLSYAGTHDPVSGRDWGGVTRNGLKLDLTQPEGEHGLFARAAYYRLLGHDVQSNNQVDALVGHYWHQPLDDENQLHLGLTLHYTQFEDNLSGFTLGHGGYFSPQQYFALTLPAGISHNDDRLHLKLATDLGVQRYKTTSSPVFPNDSVLQAQLDNSAVSVKVLEGETVSGFTFNLKAEAAYAINHRLQIGAWLASHHSNNYSETGIGLFLHYSLFKKEQIPELYRSFNSELFEEQW